MAMIFKDPELSDGAAVRGILEGSDSMFCENTFSNLYCWHAVYGAKFCIEDGCVVIGHPHKKHFNFPVGNGDKKSVITKLMTEYPDLTLSCISEKDREWLVAEFGDMFEFCELVNRFDYIYESQKLRELTGKKLAAKRNHINAFLSDGEWHTERINASHKDTLKAFNRSWCQSLCKAKDDMLREELCVADRAITNFEALCLDGLMLYKNGELIAYSIGERVSRDMYCVHIEKANPDIRGSYQMINREFCREFCTDIPYVNREDDAGDEGLRRAKKSYYPTELGRKYKAKLK